ncbi:phage tail protein, partial [Salmonella enterica]|uniref:phage tail protein n=1 Tax=Salmonella enterica TaxID=28901 RepID=UPI00398C4F9E
MQKHKSLRKALINAVPQHRNNTNMRLQFVDNGHTDSRLASSLSFEKVYVLNVVVTDFTGDLDLIFVPVQAWLREHQPDIMTTDAGREKGFTWMI